MKWKQLIDEKHNGIVVKPDKSSLEKHLEKQSCKKVTVKSGTEKKNNMEKKEKKTKKKLGLLRFLRIKKGTSSQRLVCDVTQTQTDGNDDDSMPRISMQLSFSELQEEALARGIEKKFLPKDKASLLDFLVDGSIHLRRTAAWKDIEQLKNKMEVECRRIDEERHLQILNSKTSQTLSGLVPPVDSKLSEGKQSANADGSLESAYIHLGKSADSNISVESETEAAAVLTLVTRSGTFPNSRSMQSSLVTLPTLLAKGYPTNPSRYPGNRQRHGNNEMDCNGDDSIIGAWMQILPAVCLKSSVFCRGATGRGIEEYIEKSHPMLQPKFSDLEILSDESMSVDEIQTNPSTASFSFSTEIINPPEKNKKPRGNDMQGFTVWCSINKKGGKSQPPKQFDTTFKALSDANDRARYLFHWENPWRLSPKRLMDTVFFKSSNADNKEESPSTFHCVHPNGDTWIVSVVHDSTFKFLDNATLVRHTLDQD